MEISGTVSDKSTGETLPGANVYFSDSEGNITGDNYGAAANPDGWFNVIGEGQHLTASYT